MKNQSDYEKKFRIWAKNPQVFACPKPSNLPKFKAQRFDSYEAFNQWKREFLQKITEKGGIQWMK